MSYIVLLYKKEEVQRIHFQGIYDIYKKNNAVKYWKKLYPLHKFKNCTILTEVDDIITKTEYGYDFLTMEGKMHVKYQKWRLI